MRTHFAILAVVTGAVVACSPETTAPGVAEPFAATADANGVSSPNTPVTAVVRVELGGSIVYRTSGPGNNGKGECRAEGAWYNPQTRHTSEKAHPQCATLVAGQTITVTFSEVATYVLPPSGNVQLNFAPAAGCDPLTDPLGCGRSIQYKKSQDLTVGAGVLTATESAHGTGLWTIALAAGQPFAGTGNNMDRTGTLIVACNTTLGCHPGSLSW